MIRYSYNTQTQPSAPFVHITLRNLGRDVVNAHRLILDGPQLALEIG